MCAIIYTVTDVMVEIIKKINFLKYKNMAAKKKAKKAAPKKKVAKKAVKKAAPKKKAKKAKKGKK